MRKTVLLIEPKITEVNHYSGDSITYAICNNPLGVQGFAEVNGANAFELVETSETVIVHQISEMDYYGRRMETYLAYTKEYQDLVEKPFDLTLENSERHKRLYGRLRSEEVSFEEYMKNALTFQQPTVSNLTHPPIIKEGSIEELLFNYMNYQFKFTMRFLERYKVIKDDVITVHNKLTDFLFKR